MTVRVSTLAVWGVAILALVLAGFAVLRGNQGSTVEYASAADLEAARDGLSRRIDLLAGSGEGATPVVNAAKLNGLTSEQLVRSDVEETGHVGCLGMGMWPWSSDTKYTQTTDGREVTSGEGFFDCFVTLPNGATIKALRSLVVDPSSTQEALCYMIGGRHQTNEKGYTAAYQDSSGKAATPGAVVLEDATIEGPPVDNSTFTYIVECWLSGPGVAIKAVSVEYAVAGRPIP